MRTDLAAEVLGGSVVAVARSSVHGFSKQPVVRIGLAAGLGVEGDAHSGATVQHLYQKRRDPARPNLSQVHLFAAEMLEELAAKGFALAPGEIGENVLTRGLDLLRLPEGTLLRFGWVEPCAMVRVTGLRTPCVKMDRLRPGLQQHLWGPRDSKGKRSRRAGVMGVVCASGEVAEGDAIRVALPQGPHRPLGPV